MKKITLITVTFMLSTVFCFSQTNIVTNGDFETGANGDPVPSWSGYKNRIVTDDIISDQVGQIQNGDGSLYQEFAISPGETYSVSFDYRWVDVGNSNANLTVRVKDANNLPFNLPLTGGTTSDGFTLDTTLDTWNTATFSFQVPAGITNIRFLMFKSNGNNPLNVNNVSISQNLSTERFDQYDFKIFPNPVKDVLSLSANTKIDNIQIFNLLGKQIKNINVGNSTSEVNLNELASGVYILKTEIEGNFNSIKIIKE